jgi:outer membrane protein TolC
MDRQIAAATEAQRIANVRYANGSSTYLDLINAMYTLQKVQLQKIQIEYNLCLANIELARLSGIKFY